ncbi:hypothetical protein [Polynucleobacter sp.]|uniref:hypothetical protein n=1 Tax=Polynucleobacter sp. TaxID=2029855 RepID=UPI0033421DBF
MNKRNKDQHTKIAINYFDTDDKNLILEYELSKKLNQFNEVLNSGGVIVCQPVGQELISKK